MGRKTRRQLLGQHFLHEKRILQKIVEAVEPGPEDLVVEIGPGQGALTFPLAARAGRVLAIEKDYALVEMLEKNRPGNLEIIAGDILKLDLPGIITGHRRPGETVKLAGNLPYHISSQVLFVLLEVKDVVERAVFLFQKEVAQRITATPGGKNYAPLSILLQNYFDCQLLFRVGPGAFSPPPRVDSACVLFLKRNRPLFFPAEVADELFTFLKDAFCQRRKTLSRNLESAGYRRENVRQALLYLSLGERVRAEELKPETLVSLFRLLKENNREI
ncbi:MAG: SSU rRNA (adenine(1518)-N(6)/adenine(1519)-N(6))-dimethyltransferase [Candidatus Saccharicenans subterraneus]|uniref:Ribosomal RNA small subunit methyltransferase A n=1 Tax=Candidatus Saccharicenans subterraneus TaxID=2508984 RepID=A0A3E2BN86_9BACT|nr:MAG: SSU rRNA (adenine(1518)-N(6)/adenine(1519)-N(6))-dimethyltransferase [Candidatus Saccharicenans subterraneum]